MTRRQKPLKTMSKKNITPKNLIRIILLVLCGTVLGLNVYTANAHRLLGNSLPTPFGYGAAVVLSGSMEPTFSKGDLIMVRETETYQVNDIVVFQDQNSLVVHRIIAIDGDTIITQGDANDAPDPPSTIDTLKGRVLFWIPYVGEIVNLIKTPIGTISIIAAAILLIELPRRNEKKKNREEKQKIIEEIKRLKEQV